MINTSVKKITNQNLIKYNFFDEQKYHDPNSSGENLKS